MKLWRQKVSPNNNNWRGGGKWAGVTPTDPEPEAQVAWFLVGMFWNQFLEAGDDAKMSPNKEAVFFLINIFFQNGIRKKCHQIGMDQKVSPNNNNNGDNFYLIDIV